MIYAFDGFIPVVHETAFVHPHAAVTGNVIIGRDVYIGPGAAIRGDWGGIVIEDGCNVQENCTVHMFPGVTVVLEAGAHIGHGAVVHGARIGANALIGMNARFMCGFSASSGARPRTHASAIPGAARRKWRTSPFAAAGTRTRAARPAGAPSLAGRGRESRTRVGR